MHAHAWHCHAMLQTGNFDVNQGEAYLQGNTILSQTLQAQLLPQFAPHPGLLRPCCWLRALRATLLPNDSDQWLDA